MGNVKSVVLLIDEDKKRVYATLAAACRLNGFCYPTLSKKWVDGVILHKGYKLYKKEILR